MMLWVQLLPRQISNTYPLLCYSITCTGVMVLVLIRCHKCTRLKLFLRLKNTTSFELSERMRVCQTTIAIVENVLVTNVPVPVEEWMCVLNSVPDLEVALYLDAIEFLY